MIVVIENPKSSVSAGHPFGETFPPFGFKHLPITRQCLLALDRAVGRPSADFTCLVSNSGYIRKFQDTPPLDIWFWNPNKCPLIHPNLKNERNSFHKPWTLGYVPGFCCFLDLEMHPNLPRAPQQSARRSLTGTGSTMNFNWTFTIMDRWNLAMNVRQCKTCITEINLLPKILLTCTCQASKWLNKCSVLSWKTSKQFGLQNSVATIDVFQPPFDADP